LDTRNGLRHVIEYAQDLIYYCDLEGYFTYVNPAAARVMGYDEQELVGHHFVHLVHSDYRAMAVEFYKQQIEQGTPSTYLEFVAARKDGALIWIGQHVQLVYEDGHLSGVHGIARDITQHKSIEEKLRRSEARYRSLIQGAAYGIYRSTRAGAILDANAALARMLGYESVSELMTRRMTDLYQRPEEREAVIARFSGGQYASADLRWKRKDGSPVLVHVSARAIELDDGGAGYEGIAEDITERRALEDQLRRAQRMEAIARLARGIAHDFNNVLAAIIGSGDLMELELHEDDPARAEATEIRKAAERGAALTRQLLAFARSQALPPQIVDLDAAVPRTLTMLQRLAGDAVAMNIRTAKTPTLVKVEPGQLEQLLLNLAVNARESMPDGGSIDIEVDTITIGGDDVVRYPGLIEGDYARILVRDTGVGLDADTQAELFEPFFTPKDPTKGTGLGLSIVYGIAKDAGGTVAFTSEPGRGTSFEVMLPLIERP
jgi:PAS domain S-box-containing protein